MPMLLFGNCSRNDGYTIGLEDGRRVALEELMKAARRERSRELARLYDRPSQALRALLRRAARPGQRKRPRSGTPVGPARSSADYRSDAALGHFAGEATQATRAAEIDVGPAAHVRARKAA